MRIPLPGWVLGISALGFIATWVAAPRESLSGRGPELPLAPAPRSPHSSAAGELPPPGPAPSRQQPPLFVMSRPLHVALTFDDGPHQIHTPRLLEILARHGVRATFFVNGCWLDPAYQHGQRNREVLVQAMRGGHAIGNHTYHHANLGALQPDAQTWEIVAAEQLIERVTGVRPYLFRPPYAVLPRHSVALLRARDYVAVRWNAAVADEESRTPEEIRSAVLLWLRHHQGGIVMLHDRNRASVDGTELILAGIAAENVRRSGRGQPSFRVVPLDSFLQSPTQSAGETEPLLSAGPFDKPLD